MTLDLCLQTISSSPHLLPKLEQFQTWVTRALQSNKQLEENAEINLTIRIVDEAESAELNYKYRQKPSATNVLSFPTSNFPKTSSIYLGDLVICAPLVYQEANAQGKDVTAHWAHLTIHGILHLLGYDHEEEAEAVCMEAIEINILTSLGFQNPYQDK